jgi:hypothetical protein
MVMGKQTIAMRVHGGDLKTRHFYLQVQTRTVPNAVYFLDFIIFIRQSFGYFAANQTCPKQWTDPSHDE